MKAYYYSIVHKTTNEVVDEGIITNAEDNIYPGQNAAYIDELPAECEAHHFNTPNYKLVGWYFEISANNLKYFKI